MASKAALVWNRTEFVDTESQASYEEWSPLLRGLAYVGHFGVLVPLAVLGVLATWHHRSRLGAYYAMAITYAAAVVMFYVSARYRLPLVPFLIVFASAGLAALPSIVRTAGRARIAAAAAVVVVVAIITNRPLLSADLMRATTETNLGVALQMDGRLQDAEVHYRRALALQPDYAPAHANLGMALVVLQRSDEAIDSFQRATAAGLQTAEIYDNLGIALTRAGREDEAIAAYRNSLQLNPKNGVIHLTRGSLLVKRQRFEEAIDEFRAGVALIPNSAEAHNNLGGALAASGRTAEAIVQFEQALRLNPNLASARRNLELARAREKKG